jgi:glycosyltransferase involved in cell wall biosynthesis
MNIPTTPPVPKVSVAMITYNHEKFIAQAIESVLMQKTDFPVELVIGEDCSTDTTRKLVQEYAAKYPGQIRPILHERNVGTNTNIYAVWAACRGSYIAQLEGDDYWTDPLKLQKQISLMETNPDFSMCGTAARVEQVLDGKVVQGVYVIRPAILLNCYGVKDALGSYLFHTSTFLMRAGFVHLPDWFHGLNLGDVCFLALQAEKGPIGYLDEVTSTYRQHSGGIWTGISPVDQFKNYQKALDYLNSHFEGKYCKTLQNREQSLGLEICHNCVIAGKWRAAKEIIELASIRLPLFALFRFWIRVLCTCGLDVYRHLRVFLGIRTRFRKLMSRLA